jgi:hypothetical protein
LQFFWKRGHFEVLETNTVAVGLRHVVGQVSVGPWPRACMGVNPVHVPCEALWPFRPFGCLFSAHPARHWPLADRGRPLAALGRESEPARRCADRRPGPPCSLVRGIFLILPSLLCDHPVVVCSSLPSPVWPLCLHLADPCTLPTSPLPHPIVCHPSFSSRQVLVIFVVHLLLLMYRFPRILFPLPLTPLQRAWRTRTHRTPMRRAARSSGSPSSPTS